jgi:hypothetical protein
VNIDPEFRYLLPELKKKCFYGLVPKFWYQVLYKKPKAGQEPFGYSDKPERALTDTDLINHFYRNYVDRGYRLEGGLGFSALFGANKDVVKRITWDLDEKEVKDKALKLVIPKLDHLGIDWILEHSASDKGHLSIFTEAHPDVTKAFVRQFMGELGEACHKSDLEFLGQDKVNFDEIFGAYKLKENLRFIYSYHLKRMSRYYLEFQGDNLDDPVSVVKAIVNMNPVTSDFMQSYLKADFFPEETKKVVYEGWTPETYRFQSMELKLPTETLPPKLRPVYRNCPARNTLLNRAYDDDYYLLDDRGEEVHKAGFLLAGDNRYQDIIFKNDLGKKFFFNHLLEDTRFRDAGSHNWWFGEDDDPPTKYFQSCKYIHETFNLCEGCVHFGRIDSAKDILFGSPISRKPTNTDKKLVTLEHVRTKTIPAFMNKVKSNLLNLQSENMWLASVMGTGKSHAIKELVTDLAWSSGAKVLISVHDGDSALSYREFFRSRGINAFVLMSHANIFRHQDKAKNKKGLSSDDCPNYLEMQADLKDGVQSSSVKSEFCESCPLYDTCYYPNQYKQVMEEDYGVVIIQHAHLSCREVIFDLLKKKFDIFVLDENFLDFTFNSVEINQVEIELLGGLEIEWASRLSGWLSCRSKAKGKIEPTRDELKAASDLFKAMDQKYRVPDLIRYYNEHRIVDPLTGIEIVYELPKVPITIFTDATQDIELMKQLTGYNRINVYGDNEILDITQIHPENERIQLLDGSNSVTRMGKDEYFTLIMKKTCELVKSRTDWENVLITCYDSQRKRVTAYIEDNYPEIMSRIDIGLMNKGTNKWSHFDAQFIIAGVYMIPKVYYELTYRFKAVANYYRIKKGKAPLPNVFDDTLTPFTSAERKSNPIEAFMKIGEKLRLFLFPDWNYYSPAIETDPSHDFYWFNRIFNLNLGSMEQAERLRWFIESTDENPEPEQKPRTVFHLHPYPLKHLLLTKVLTVDQFLKY